ncbi:MAG: hypothetical protein ABIB79_00810 [archaeon]
MLEGIGDIGTQLSAAYAAFITTLDPWVVNFLGLFFLVILIVIYSVFIWKFYRFIAHKNIISLNLNKYNKYEHPLLTKLVAGVLYLIEYIIILPFLIFFWFGVFTLFLIFLTEGITVDKILIISVGVIGAIRMTAYIPRYGQDLAKDLAKLLPFTMLAIAITKPGFFDVQRILGHFGVLPELFSQIIIYLLFIVLLEIVLRIFDFGFSLLGLEEPREKEEGE